jgi:hypothetical protein
LFFKFKFVLFLCFNASLSALRGVALIALALLLGAASVSASNSFAQETEQVPKRSSQCFGAFPNLCF